MAEVRRRVGTDLLIGLSTHSPEQFDAGLRSEADQLSVGPVWETPTKAGRPAAGLEYVRYAAERAGSGTGLHRGHRTRKLARSRAGARSVVVLDDTRCGR